MGFGLGVKGLGLLEGSLDLVSLLNNKGLGLLIIGVIGDTTRLTKSNDGPSRVQDC